jgi:hypothetical protein
VDNEERIEMTIWIKNMDYIEITIWNPFKRGNFSLVPRFKMWDRNNGFDFDWLFFSVNASLWNDYG